MSGLLKANRSYEVIVGVMTGLFKTNRRYKVIDGVMTGLLKARLILEVVSIDDLLAAGELPPHLAGKARTYLITTW